MSSHENPAPQTWPATPETQPTAVMYLPTSTNAIVALVLAIAAWVIFPISIIFSIIALVFASMASKEIKAAGGALGGKGMVTAARIVSWINIGLWIAGLAFGLIFLVILLIAGASGV